GGIRPGSWRLLVGEAVGVYVGGAEADDGDVFDGGGDGDGGVAVGAGPGGDGAGCAVSGVGGRPGRGGELVPAVEDGPAEVGAEVQERREHGHVSSVR